MNILGDTICFQEDERSGFSAFDGCAVIARAERLVFWDRHETQEFVQQFVLGADFHFMRSGHWSVP